MKVLITSVLLLLLYGVNGQATQVDIVDFYHWTASDGNDYEMVVVTPDFWENEETPATIRVRYSRGGSYSVVEFYSVLSFEYDEDSNLIIYLLADSEAEFIQGAGSYSPDNFVLKFDTAGALLYGYQADNNELDKPDDEIIYADLYLTEYGDSDNLRATIRKFYSSSDPMYRELMDYTTQFD